MDLTYSVSVKLIQGILQAAEVTGLSAAALMAATGISPEVLANPDARIAHRQWVALWQELARRSNDPCLGARLAAVTQFESFNVTGYAMSHSPTLGLALARLVRYSRLLCEGIEFVLAVEGAKVTLTYQTISPALALPPLSVGWTFANLVLWAERSMGRPWQLQQIRLQQLPPAQDQPYCRIFRQVPVYRSGYNALCFDADWLEAPLVNADGGLCELLDRYADSLVAKLPPSQEFVLRLQHALAAELRGNEPKLEAIAQQLGYSPRTLQRKLQQTGVSFQSVMDTVRRELAFQYLQDAQLTLSEIAFLLGFSENTGFSRAFRRWTGITPGAYRKAHAVAYEWPKQAAVSASMSQ